MDVEKQVALISEADKGGPGRADSFLKEGMEFGHILLCSHSDQQLRKGLLLPTFTRLQPFLSSFDSAEVLVPSKYPVDIANQKLQNAALSWLTRLTMHRKL